MSKVFRLGRLAAAVTAAACVATAGNAFAESMASLPARTVGPSTFGQVSPAPAGGWQASDDRTVGASINGQGGWQTVTFSPRYDEEIASGVGHTGGHAWRLSNWFHTGLVDPILSPAFTPVGENATSNHVVYEFWFRSASALPDPGSIISTTLGDSANNRMTYLGIFDELPGDANSHCPDVAAGCFHVDAIDVSAGADSASPGDAVFVDHYSAPLVRGAWYRARIDATFVAGPGAACPSTPNCHLGNDQVRYQVFDDSGNSVFDSGVIGSWEAAYYDGQYGNAPLTLVSVDHAAFRVAANADDGSQQPYDTWSVANRPHGVYIDDLSVTPTGGTGFSTSFEFDRYVAAANGVDSGDCTDATHPCRTIAYAIGVANPYDTIQVAKGVYAEHTGASNLVIDKPLAIVGSQAGVDARTRDLGGAADANETIIVPGVADASLSLSSLGSSAVVTIASGVSLDGLVIDGDNTALTSTLNLNGANPDADTGVSAAGSKIAVRNTIIRNVGGAGILADNTTASGNTPGGDNIFQFDRFTNITNPSIWGVGIYAGDNFYAQISDNLMDQVRVGVQTENNQAPSPGLLQPAVVRNEIHATRTGLFHNLFYQLATTYTIADNHIFASANAAQGGQWRGIQIDSMQDAQTVIVSGNVIDGSGLTGRPTAGYVLNNWVSSESASTAIDGGSVSNVDVGVLATDAVNYSGPVNGSLIQNIAFHNIATGAIYVEDTSEVAGTAATTIGSGNTYIGVTHQLVLAGAAPAVSFSGIAGVDSVLVRAAGSYFYGVPNSNSCPAGCTVANAVINDAIAAANAGGTVYIEKGTFDQAPVIGAGKDGLRLTAADSANPPTLTRASGTPNKPVLVVSGNPAPKNVTVDHLNFVVDRSYAAEGLLAGGFVDGLSVHDNQFTQTWSNTGAKAAYAQTNAISINVSGNSLGLPRVDGSNVSIANNTIAGSTSPNTTHFRAGIAMDGGVGTISGNASAGLNHDAIVRFATTVAGGGNGLTISGNTFNGGGLEVDAPNAGVAPITIANNTITAAAGSPALGMTQAQLEADAALLRLIGNVQNIPVAVSGNTFAGYANGYRGALVENFPNTTFADNHFSPLSGAADFVSLVVSNKAINSDNPPAAPYAMSLVALRNVFNGSGTANAGRAVEFLDDNDANGTASFGTIALGDSTAANANSFDANHHFYVNLVDQICDTVATPCTFLDYKDVGAIPNTQVRPFRGLVSAANNKFGGVMPAAMTPSQQAQLQLRTNDVLADSGLGYVDYGLSSIALSLASPSTAPRGASTGGFSAHLTSAGNKASENVVVAFTISRATGTVASGDVALQYDAGGGNFVPMPLTACGANLCGTFGPADGFGLGLVYDVTTAFKATFAHAGAFTLNASVDGVTSHTTYATATSSVTVSPTPATVSIGNTTQVRNGSPKPVSVTTTPSGLTFSVTYDGSTTAPSAAGSYAVVATITDPDYSGSSNATLQVNPYGAATNIAANSATTVNGLAGTAASPLPSVKVTDAFGNAVPGYSITFVAGANSGTLSGATPATDANGIATLGGWTLGTAASESVTVTTALGGSPVTFNASVGAQFDLAVSMSVSQSFVQYGHTLDYTITVTNAGPSDADNQVTDNLPPEIKASTATWICQSHSAGATCMASGTHSLSDTPHIPAGGSVVYVLSAPVFSTLSDSKVLNQVRVDTTNDSNPANNSATTNSTVVLFRDAFDGDGSTPSSTQAPLDMSATLSLDPANVPQAGAAPSTWVRVVDASGREVFRIEVLGSGASALVRLVSSDASGEETHSDWVPVQAFVLGLGNDGGNLKVLLIGAKGNLELAIPTWIQLPLTVYMTP
jgi:uncharacterized repeat protein (TIGR01451 family)